MYTWMIQSINLTQMEASILSSSVYWWGEIVACVWVCTRAHTHAHTHTPTHTRTQTHTHIPKHHIWANNPTLLTQCMLHTSVWLFNILILLFILLFIYTHKPIQSVCQLIYHHLVLFTTTVLLLYNYSTLTPPPPSTKGSCDSLVVTVCMHMQVCLCACAFMLYAPNFDNMYL